MAVRISASLMVVNGIRTKFSAIGKFTRPLSTVVTSSATNSDPSTEELLSSPFRCPETNPINHKLRHEGKFYTIPSEDHKRLFTFGGFPKHHVKRMGTFGEVAFMVRRPALEVINYIENTNFSHPVNKYVFYGVTGAGKSISVNHVLHYLACKDFLLVHVPWAPMWVRLFKETAPSIYKPGRVDHPFEAVVWLQHFRVQNQKMLQTLEPKVTNTYTWSKREVTEKGSLFTDLIDQGINRPKFATDCVGALVKEVKILANSGICKVALVLDGVNCLFHSTRIKRDDRSIVEPDEVTLVHAFRKMLNNDWKNGVVVTSVDSVASPSYAKASYLPRYLLTKTGFEIMDPFVPVFVDNYSDKEINSCLDYYIDRKWIQSDKGKTEDGRQQLMFLSGYNPAKLIDYCASL